MEPNGTGTVMRVVMLALVAVAIWFVGRDFNGQPEPRGPDAPATQFSAARAYATLGRLAGPEIRHPVSSAANAAVRDRVREEFAALGIQTRIYRALGCYNLRAKFGISCGTTEDVVAEVAPGAGKAIILLAHYDSVPAGPGTADDLSGVATILETVRALKARGMKTVHPIIAVASDGEEAGLLGADAFLSNPALKARVGAVINVEARGNQGPSILFQTSPGDGPLIELYAKNVPEAATSSLFAVIYKFLPNNTDLTLFIDQGFTSFNFAFTGNVAHYHTPLDTRANLSRSSLQQHGDNMLGVAGALMQTDFEKLKGNDGIYLALLGKFVPRLPASWALPLAVVTFLLLILAAYLSRGEAFGIGHGLLVFSIPVVALLGSAAFGWLLHEVAALVSGQPDPSYAFPMWLRIALALGVTTMLVLLSRLASARMTALSVWFWMSGLAILSGALLPGLCPYFLFPSMIGSVLLLAQSRFPGAWSGTAGQTMIFLAALPCLLIWLSFVAGTESVLGLAAHLAFTVPATLGAMTLLPLLAARPFSRSAWIVATSSVGAMAIAAAVIAGLQPAFSATAPQRINFSFVDDHVANRSVWTVETQAPLPKALRDVMPFSDKPDRVLPIAIQSAYFAPAGATRFKAPTASIVSTLHGSGRYVTLTLQGSVRANRMFVVVPNGSGLNLIEMDGRKFTPAKEAASPSGTVFGCVTDDCRSRSLTLGFDSTRPVEVLIGEQRYGLPPDGMKLVSARPNTAIASQTGDSIVVFGKVKLP